jgi:hyaluronoglucosaminidase
MSNTPILLRGIVEGFYGEPWNYEIRADLIRFCGEYNLNAYIYAPKDDPYHRDKWREPYPEDKLLELKNLAEVSTQNNVHFIFAVSPGLDRNYEGEKGEQDFQSMVYKLDAMYNVGIRDFAIFFDDLSGTQSGTNHANFLNKLQNALDQKYTDVYPLITVPTDYTRNWMIDESGNVKPYTQEFASLLNPNIIVLYTGDDVVCDGISEESFQAAKDIYGRDLGVWWNYPVNDYYLNDVTRNFKLALGPMEKLPKAKPNSIFYNPMEQPLLSKISIGTGADYALSTDTYEPTSSWNRIIEKQFGELAAPMKIFASHSQRMEYSIAKCGPADAPEFYAKAHQAVLDTKEGKTVDFTELQGMINEMISSADILLNKLPSNILNESVLMLEQFKRIANADMIAMQSLKNHKLDAELKNLFQEIKNNESKAMVSELSGVLFIEEVINLFG